jgi:hypothetical protein
MESSSTADIELSAAVSLRSPTTEDAEAIRALTREACSKWVPVIGRLPHVTVRSPRPLDESQVLAARTTHSRDRQMTTLARTKELRLVDVNGGAGSASSPKLFTHSSSRTPV